MIVKTQDLKNGALIYCLWLAEGGMQHNRHTSMWFFPRRKRCIQKAAWKPWQDKFQAFELMEDHGLCVWEDSEGWHAGFYGESDELSFFVDAKTPAMALCLAAITKRFGPFIDVPEDLLAEQPETTKKKRTAAVV